jgi:hypothetical protein
MIGAPSHVAADTRIQYFYAPNRRLDFTFDTNGIVAHVEVCGHSVSSDGKATNAVDGEF